MDNAEALAKLKEAISSRPVDEIVEELSRLSEAGGIDIVEFASQLSEATHELRSSHIHDVMMGIPESWRYRWCSGGPCACMGGANCSGEASSKGVSHRDWQKWVEQNPNPIKPSNPNTIEEFLRTME